MAPANSNQQPATTAPQTIPWFGVRKVAHALLAEVQELQSQRDSARGQLERIGAMANELVSEIKTLRTQNGIAHKQLEALGALSVVQLEVRRTQLDAEIVAQASRLARERADAAATLATMKKQYAEIRQSIVETEDIALLQEVGVYKYRHPLTDAVAYEKQLAAIDDRR